jgi:hypothetical protein
MNKTDENTTEQMRQAIATYAGPVTRCPPGRARAPAETAVVMNASVEWLRENQDARPVRDTKAPRRKMRMTRAQQQRLAKRNASQADQQAGTERNAPCAEERAHNTPLDGDGAAA